MKQARSKKKEARTKGLVFINQDEVLNHYVAEAKKGRYKRVKDTFFNKVSVKIDGTKSSYILHSQLRNPFQKSFGTFRRLEQFNFSGKATPRTRIKSIKGVVYNNKAERKAIKRRALVNVGAAA